MTTPREHDLINQLVRVEAERDEFRKHAETLATERMVIVDKLEAECSRLRTAARAEAMDGKWEDTNNFKRFAALKAWLRLEFEDMADVVSIDAMDRTADHVGTEIHFYDWDGYGRDHAEYIAKAVSLITREDTRVVVLEAVDTIENSGEPVPDIDTTPPPSDNAGG